MCLFGLAEQTMAESVEETAKEFVHQIRDEHFRQREHILPTTVISFVPLRTQLPKTHLPVSAHVPAVRRHVLFQQFLL